MNHQTHGAILVVAIRALLETLARLLLEKEMVDRAAVDALLKTGG
jgi:hypothetical protein